MMRKRLFNKREVLVFRQFKRKGWALFASLGREVVISVLSVATLSSACAATLSGEVSLGGTQTDTTRTTALEVCLDDVGVTGSHAPLAQSRAARMVTVLTRDDIQAAPVQSVNDLLKMAVGVDVRQRGALGSQTDISIRGGTQEQIAILLNGINICDPQTGHNTFDLPCDISDIVRIEVLEGPAARVYGTSSLVGAINIVTSSSPKLGEVRRGLNMRIEGGSYGYLTTVGRLENASHSLSANYTRSDGYSRSKAGHLNSDYQGGKAFYQGGYEREQVQLNWHAGVSAKGWGSNTFYSAKYDEQYEKTIKLYTALQGNLTTGLLHIKPAIYWNRNYDRFELIRGAEDKVPFNHHRTDVFGINLNSWFDWLLGRTACGAEFRNEDIVSTNLGEPLSHPHGDYKVGLNRTNLSFHLEHNVTLHPLTLSAGFIAVKNTWNGMPFTIYPGADVSVRMDDHWKVYVSYNESLRMPSFTELYYSVGGHKADKYLKPEELRAVEGGIKYRSPHLTAQASIFYHHAANIIDWVMDTRDATATWQSVNHTKINTLGQEVSISTDLANLIHFPSAFLHIAYCHLHEEKDEQPFLQSQYALEYLRHKVTAQGRLQLTRHLQMTVGYRWQDRMGSYTTVQGEVKDYSPYSVVDARLAWDDAHYSIYVEGNNLTNHPYVDHGNVPQPGTWMIAGVKVALY